MKLGGFETRPYIFRAFALLYSFRCLRKFLTVANFPRQRYLLPVALSPLSSLPRDGGDIRGGSFDSWLRLGRARFFAFRFLLFRRLR